VNAWRSWRASGERIVSDPPILRVNHFAKFSALRTFDDRDAQLRAELFVRQLEQRQLFTDASRLVGILVNQPVSHRGLGRLPRDDKRVFPVSAHGTY
jgi:hypothetical protein